MSGCYRYHWCSAKCTLQNPDLSPEQRAEDLLGRLTLEEKVRLMQNESFPVERLGIAHYDWWNEASRRSSPCRNSYGISHYNGNGFHF